MTDAVAAVVDSWFAGQAELPVERPGGGAWYAVLRGERKRAIPVHLQLGAHHLSIQSFFMRTPDERHAEAYAFLLRRNTRSYTLRFALYDSGDVMLVGVVPRHAVTEAEIDRLLGQLLSVADDAYWPAIRLGFGSYIEREQAWRASAGLGRNPIS